ncbi:Ldh family oxidoreductase [Kaistia dalseonensis]|uniref:Delta1-piperideine-2-carboxylate reductase n=1 Tax=Kaistia dalseonensis TaxID=410840 RepID=A0ABU0HFM2_9HYPH|nr:Ldh family oxidoreductase [Kaistia dalseonensis]MCX5497677.1 Ldh family oxidoreductase [Kaistia dalseonensis]MDQ0440321.1 delta1-piperideine-2-carboxylate reductase [Kaistia dalseonensis]
MKKPVPGARRVPFDRLIECLTGIFERHGCSASVAAILAENCASAERDAAESHGLFRMPGYVSTLRSGWVDGRALPVVEDVAPGFVRVDAQNGFTQPALAAGRALLIEKVRTNGIAIIAIRNSHHFAALSLDVEPFASEGFVALAFINSMAVVVPHGAKAAVFGTNPIAFASPRADGPPVVFDMATSAMAHGDVSLAARENRPVPPGIGVDSAGQPTTDAAAILGGGALLPFGGHKGSAIAMMIEILCAAIVGSRFSYEVDWSSHPGAKTPNTGETIIVIDPNRGNSGLAPFAARVEELIGEMQEAGQERLPGDRRQAARRERLREGIPLSPAAIAMIEELGGHL